MDQNRLQESTMKAAKKPLELTRSAMVHTQKTLEKTQELSRFAAEKSKKLRTPSAKSRQNRNCCGRNCRGGPAAGRHSLDVCRKACVCRRGINSRRRCAAV